MAKDQYKTLIEILHQLKSEDSEFKNWVMLNIYDYKCNIIGFTITVTGKEKK